MIRAWILGLGLALPLAGHAAGEAALFRDLVPGARASAMGGAVVAEPGIDSVGANPAGLAFCRDGALQASHLALIQDVSLDQVVLEWPFWFGSLGADLRWLTAPDLTALDAQDHVVGSVPTQESSYGLLWALQWHGMAAGLAVNSLSMDLGGSQAGGISFDGGLQCALPEGFYLGASLRNGGSLDALANAADSLKPERLAGLSWRNEFAEQDSLELACQFFRQASGDWQAIAAAEFGLSGQAFLRGSFIPIQPAGQAAAWSAGIGARLGYLDLDGAWIPYGDLGNTYRVTATFYPQRFGNPGIK